MNKRLYGVWTDERGWELTSSGEPFFTTDKRMAMAMKVTLNKSFSTFYIRTVKMLGDDGEPYVT